MADPTPGPWEVQRYTVNADGKEVSPWSRGDLSIKTRVVDRAGTRVADCHWTNARLIAAAPDLLAVLKAVLDVGAVDAAACEVTFGLCPETTRCPDCDARRAAIRAANAAIAKAEGPRSDE